MELRLTLTTVNNSHVVAEFFKILLSIVLAFSVCNSYKKFKKSKILIGQSFVAFYEREFTFSYSTSIVTFL